MYDCQRSFVPEGLYGAFSIKKPLQAQAPGRGDNSVVDESYNIPRGDEIKYFHLDSCNTGGKADLD